MPRMKRIVIPGIPFHITNRGNRRQQIFFNDEHKKTYLELLRRFAERFGLKIWAYCLMFNHIHLIALLLQLDSMHLTIRETHKKYTNFINLEKDWKGSLWQGRYDSFPLEEAHLYQAFRYVENNPVRAGIVKYAEEYRWSSARAHVFNTPDPVLSESPFKSQIKDWRAYLRKRENEAELQEIRDRIRTGRPFGSEEFIDRLEKTLDREIRPRKPGPKLNSGVE
ncbi:MAG: transposase [Candidatus Aminicenantes bacterium]|nr:transposase [Candidatus Aminicenantes bacterium]